MHKNSMALLTLEVVLLACGCSNSARDAGSTGKNTVNLTDSRDGSIVTVKREECFSVSGNPQTITILPLDPKVTDAVLSNFDSLTAKAGRELGDKAGLYHLSLQESMQRGNLERVAQKILYYEFFGEILPLD